MNSRCFDIGENPGLTNTAIGFCRGVPTLSRAAKGGETFSGMMTKAQRRASINFPRVELLGNALGSAPKNHPQLGIANWPVGSRTTVGSAAHQPYGVAANIIGRMDSGWQNNSGSLWFDARWLALWRKFAESGPGHGNKKKANAPFIRRSQKNGLAWANGQ